MGSVEDFQDVGTSEGPTEGIDWSSVEQVAGHVSRTTLASMQQLWRTHSTAMDSKGRQFAETVYSLHAQAIKEVASMKNFELKPVLAAMNAFTTGVRETVLEIFQAMRQADDDFAQAVYQTSRRAFARTLREALEAWDINSAAKLRHLRAAHAEELETQRRAAEASAQQRLIAHEAVITKKLKEEHKRKLTQAVTAVANLALAKDQEQQQRQQQQQQPQQPQQQQDPSLGDAFASRTLRRASVSNAGLGAESSSANLGREGHRWAARQESLRHEGTPRGPVRTLSVNWGERGDQRPGQPNNHSSDQLQGSLGGGPVSGAGEGPAPSSRPGTSALGLEVLSLLADEDEDSPVNSVLACKEMEVQLRHAREDLQEQKTRMDEMNHQLQLQQADVGKWKDKWIQEGAKSDGIKRECLQIVVKCEQRVNALQQEHLAEMSKRDMLLQRTKDTIIRLEAQLAAHTGQHLDMRMLPHDTLLSTASPTPCMPTPLPPLAGSIPPLYGGGTPSEAYPAQPHMPPGKSLHGGFDMPGMLALQGLGLDTGGEPGSSPCPASPLKQHAAAREEYPSAPPAPGGTSSARPSMTGQMSMHSQAGPASDDGSNYFD